MSIATKTGDNGTTALMYGRRVKKMDSRVAAYGAVDELNAALGMARATAADLLVGNALFAIQKELVVLMGDLAVAPEDQQRYRDGGYGSVTAEMVDGLTAIVDNLEKNHQLTFKGWATPGGTLGAAALDVARTVCRRAEREVVGLAEQQGAGAVGAETVRYLNRLSDVCWLFARYTETRSVPADHEKATTLTS